MAVIKRTSSWSMILTQSLGRAKDRHPALYCGYGTSFTNRSFPRNWNELRCSLPVDMMPGQSSSMGGDKRICVLIKLLCEGVLMLLAFGMGMRQCPCEQCRTLKSLSY